MRRRVAARLLCFVLFGGFAASLDYQPRRDMLSDLIRLLDDRAAASELAAPPALPAVADSYAVAKRWLFEQVYDDHRETLYCRCPFDRDKRVDQAACGYQVRDNPERAERVEVEHVVPASWIGQGRPCWQQRLCVDASGRRIKGRKCCARIDPAYRAAYNDLHNLWPSIGEINERRRHYQLGLVPGEVSQLLTAVASPFPPVEEQDRHAAGKVLRDADPVSPHDGGFHGGKAFADGKHLSAGHGFVSPVGRSQ